MGNSFKTLGLLVIIAAITFAGVYLYQRYDDRMRQLAAASADWPSVAGLITHSELDVRRKEVGVGKKTRFRVDVTYEFVVDRQVYRNHVVRFDQNNLPNDRKELLVGSYPVGKRVEVFYNPDDPDQSVLVRDSYDGGLP